MASTSSIGRAGSKGSAITTRPGALATWWRAQKGEWPRTPSLASLLASCSFLAPVGGTRGCRHGRTHWRAQIADRQDGLARDLANQAEVLENTRFVRQIATSRGRTPKPFASMNLSGAQLGGLLLICADMRLHRGCADFSKADLHEADLRRADLREADLYKADLHWASFRRASLWDANFEGVGGERVDFRDAMLMGTSLVHARLDDANFTDAGLGGTNADEAVLHSADFSNAHLGRSHFKRADLRDAIFRSAEIIHVDLTSADLRNANFTGAEMIDIDLTLADLRGADFTRTHLRRAVLTDVCFDATTKWGTTSPPTSSTC
jgi:uncharacterized protein YjbI with pentapeptide repeats